MKYFTIIICLIIILAGFYIYKNKKMEINNLALDMNSKQTMVNNISGEEALKLLNEDRSIIVIDVRTREEFKSGHLNESVNIDWNDQENFKSYVRDLDKNKTYLLYCKSDNRSIQAANYMSNIGFSNIYNLKGGIMGNNLPLIK